MNMKKLLSTLLAVLMLLSAFSVFAADVITVEIDGAKLESDVPPTIINDRTMVPLRAIFEALDAKVDWNDNTKTVTGTKGDTVISLTVGNSMATKNREIIALDSPPVIVDSRTLVPVRFISESLGCQVGWDGDKRLVTISTEAAPKADEGEYYKVVNVTANKDDGNKPANTIDSDWQTRWSAEGEDCWITYELEESKEIGYIGAAFYSGGERQTKFDILVSDDGANFTEVKKDLLSTLTSDMQPFAVGAKGKFIKLACHGNTTSLWNSISEVRIYAPNEDGSMGVAPTPEIDYSAIPVVKKPDGVSDEIWAAVTQFDKVCGKEIIDFLLSTYDPETGGFTNSPSGVYTPGFEGELEATATWLAGFPGMGLITDYQKDPFVPQAFREKIIKFYQDRQSPEDGYWYDTYYGNHMIETKRERTSGKALGNLRQFGGEPLYKTYQERIDEIAAQKVTAQAEDSSLPEHFRSEEAYIQWMADKNWTDGVYKTGNEITNSISTAVKLGYGDAALEFILSKQNPRTGCWGVDTITDDTTNGALKLSDAIKHLGGKYPYVEQAIETVITFVENETTPANMCTIWNPLILICNIRATHDNKFPDDVQKRLDERIVYLLDKTAKFLEMFKCKDGGYKYYLDIPMAEHGGVVSAVGLDRDGNMEGNEDSTYIGTFLMRNSVYGAAGLAATPIWAQYKQYFWSEIEKKLNAPYEKKYEEGEVYEENFEDIEDVEELYDTWAFVLQGDKDENRAVIKDPLNRKNRCLRVNTAPTVNTKGYADYFNTNFLIPESKTYSVEFKFMVDSASTEPLFSFYIGSRAVALMLVKNETVGEGGGGMALTWKHNESGPGKSNGGILKTGLEKDVWYTLKVEYTPDGKENTNTKFYLSGELLGETDKFYNGGFPERFPVKTMRNITIMSYGRSCTATLYLDDIKVSGVAQ